MDVVTYTLYGGAMTIDLPSTFRNMSDLVPIPDNQEVFQEMSQNPIGIFICELNEPTLDPNPG